MNENPPGNNPEPYRAQVFTRDGKGYCRIPELSIVTSGDSVQTAYEVAQDRVAALREICAEADILESLPQPESDPREGVAGGTVAPRSDLRSFVIKTAIVVAALIFLMLPIALTVSNAVERSVAKLNIKGGKDFWGKLERELAKAARPSNDLPPEKQEELLRHLRVIVARIKPFTDTLSPLFDECEAACSPLPAEGKAPKGDNASN